MSYTLSELAGKFSLILKGCDCDISGVASLEDATPAHLSFLRDEKHLDAARHSKAGALVVSPNIADIFNCPLLVSEDPYLAFIRIKRVFTDPVPLHEHRELTFIHPDAVVDEEVEIAPFTYIGSHVVLGKNVKIHSGVRILDHSVIGDNTVVYPNTVIFDRTTVGEHCVIGANSVIGGDGFGFHFAEGKHHKVPQTGCVRIGSHVEIGSNVSIDRAVSGETVIGDGCKIDNQVQIAHNVKIGNHALVVAQAGVSGSTEIGDYSVLAGKAGLVGHIKIGKQVTIGGASVVTKSIPDGKFVIGYPATDEREWKKQMIYLSKLPELSQKIKRIEKTIREMEEKGHGD